jgi:4'-phosphopantetheinyl transferase
MVSGLSEGRIHLWRIGLDGADAPLSGLLAPDEVERALRFATPGLRARYVAGRSVVRQILAAYCGADPQQLELGCLPCPSCGDPHGKPIVLDQDAHGLSFNLAHSGGYALLAVTRGAEVGVDVEWCDPAIDIESIAVEILSKAELEMFRSLEAESRIDYFYDRWTLKEAYSKGRGLGLTLPFDDIVVSSVGRVSLSTRLAQDSWVAANRSVWEGFASAIAFAGQVMPPILVRDWPGLPVLDGAERPVSTGVW